MVAIVFEEKITTFVIPNGAWAGRLGTGLQNQLERFNSARHLKKSLSAMLRGVFLFLTLKSVLKMY